jgi:hypothetical protein
LGGHWGRVPMILTELLLCLYIDINLNIHE